MCANVGFNTHFTNKFEPRIYEFYELTNLRVDVQLSTHKLVNS